MLKRLTIKNYALIRSLELEPAAGLNVITGETGAGKSIVLGAIGLLTGNRADTKVLWNPDEKCIIEGVFDVAPYRIREVFDRYELDYEDLTVIRREISPTGKSRAFINDTPITLDVMRYIGGLLLDIHSQNENYLSGQLAYQLNLIDTYAGNEKVRKAYSSTWKEYVDAKKNYEALSEQAATIRKEEDYIRFQLDELAKADLQEDEQSSLEAESQVMDHATEIREKVAQATSILSESEYSVSTSITTVRNLLQSISSYSEAYAQLLQRIDSLRIELDDVAEEIKRIGEQVEFDPERAVLVKERLDLIYRLQKKHGVQTVGELIELRQKLQQQADQATNLDAELAEAKAKLETATQALRTRASELSATRKKVFAELTKELTTLLAELGIPAARLEIAHRGKEPDASGSDHVDLLFSANKGIAPRPLAQVASGGEFSRLMLCIKYVLAERAAIPTLILDEIDSGVSGEIAIKLGAMMKRMARQHQLITITHLPQIAARGNAHYHVYKDNASKKASSNIRVLNEDERILEIAAMIGGDKPSETAIAGARELFSRQ
ncbi:MAG TPA: DNA repair protein RecN [Cyclobacteriaceae bacterium]|jgi:DNA repair protein RecN (Recombination protein N)